MSDELKITFSAKNAAQDVFKEVDLRARAKMSSDRELTYQAAVHAVFTDPAAPDAELLHRTYLSSVPPLRQDRRS